VLSAITWNLEKCQRKEQFGDLDVDERVILKLIMQKEAIKM
jgi:hypothetical protein